YLVALSYIHAVRWGNPMSCSPCQSQQEYLVHTHTHTHTHRHNYHHQTHTHPSTDVKISFIIKEYLILDMHTVILKHSPQNTNQNSYKEYCQISSSCSDDEERGLTLL